MVTTEVQRLPYGFLYARNQCRNVRCLLDPGLDDRKFVTAQSCDQVGVADAAAQPACEGHEQLVADRMPERVVDGLEVIEIEIENGQPRAAMNPA